MPELPDIVVYLEALERRVMGEELSAVRVASPSVLRTFDPPYDAAVGLEVVGLRRIGKRIVFEFPDGLFIVIHLMIAGRLRWAARGASVPKKVGLAALDFPSGSLILTEQGTKKRAGLWVISGEEALAEQDRGGIEPLEMGVGEMTAALRAENRTIKRALTDPRVLSGIGNAYSDEILWEARLAPTLRTRSMTDEQMKRLHDAIQTSLTRWTDNLREEVGEGWPERVTAFRSEMAVHGKYGEPCPRCGSAVQRIVYADNETNYCATCQTDGRLLADRSLSRLLKDDWPKHIDELE
ncbi:MAG TPA: DNA-formamidopyrimidine glycosylase family protein [Acidimicrobiia bacterium]|nr:DNA-formamidopyrimidine glycosylase family protein [Acidimicrobiia bacterium]